MTPFRRSWQITPDAVLQHTINMQDITPLPQCCQSQHSDRQRGRDEGGERKTNTAHSTQRIAVELKGKLKEYLRQKSVFRLHDTDECTLGLPEVCMPLPLSLCPHKHICNRDSTPQDITLSSYAE